MDMKTKTTREASTGYSLNMIKIFRDMMEKGYYPSYEEDFIMFETDGNPTIVEYNEGILSIRQFFVIDKEDKDIFGDVSNLTMTKTILVKPVIVEGGKAIMFSCESLCGTLNEFRKYFPRMLDMLKGCIRVHKTEMKQFIMAQELAKTALPAAEESSPVAGGSCKMIS